MAFDETLLEIMVCPACRAQLDLKPDHSGLQCVACRRFYRFQNDVPMMNPDEATIEE